MTKSIQRENSHDNIRRFSGTMDDDTVNTDRATSFGLRKVTEYSVIQVQTFTQGIELLFSLIEGLSFIFDMSDNQIVLSTNYSSDQEAIQRLVISEVILEESEWFNIYTTGIFDQMLWLVTLDVLNEVESSTYLTTVPHLVLTVYPDIPGRFLSQKISKVT